MSLVVAGIVGLGQMGILHAAMTNSIEGSKVVAICDNDSFLMSLAKKALPHVRFYSEYIEMLRRENLDALYICTPVQTHSSIVHEIAANDWNVSLFVEKPLAGTFDEANKMVASSNSISGITMVGFQKRFAGVFCKFKELLAAQAIGDISFVRSHIFGSSVLGEKKGWKYMRGSGGATLEYGVHLLDLLIWYFGEPTRVEAKSKSIFSPQVEDYVYSGLEFPGDVVGSLEICWSMRNYAIPELLIEVHGENGCISATEDRITVVLNHSSGDNTIEAGSHAFYRSELDQNVPFLIANPENVLQEKAFLECVSKRIPPDQDFRSGARVNRFVDLLLPTSR